jgi:phosphotransacetylase
MSCEQFKRGDWVIVRFTNHDALGVIMQEGYPFPYVQIWNGDSWINRYPDIKQLTKITKEVADVMRSV